MTFVERAINVTFRLGTGSFGQTGANTVKLTDHRIRAHIQKAGGNAMSRASLRIYGMTLQQMNELSTLGQQLTFWRQNTVTVEAGDVGETLTTVFIGTIQNAYPDFEAAPDVAFVVEAFTGLFESVQNTEPTVIDGPTQVATVMQTLATKMGLRLENNGIDTVITNIRLEGAVYGQIVRLASQAGIEFIVDLNVLAIWKPGFSRGQGQIPILSATDGTLIGYPAYNSKGIIVRALFNPALTYGGKLEVRSIFKPNELEIRRTDLQRNLPKGQSLPASGIWVSYMLDYQLEAQVPKGAWFTVIAATTPGNLVVASR